MVTVAAWVAKKSTKEIQQWAEDYLMRLLDTCAELGITSFGISIEDTVTFPPRTRRADVARISPTHL